MDTGLELAKDIAGGELSVQWLAMGSNRDIRLESQGNDGLDDGREHESPCPS